MCSDVVVLLDLWHLVQDFVVLLVLNLIFIEDDLLFDWVMQVIDEDVVKLDIFYDCKVVRLMLMYFVPGFIDYF